MNDNIPFFFRIIRSLFHAFLYEALHGIDEFLDVGGAGLPFYAVVRLEECVRNITGAALPFPVETAFGSGLTVDWDGAAAFIQAEDRAALCRGLFLLSCAVQEKKTALHVKERRHFAHCGAMLDMSRNRVMTVEGVKKWIDRQAALGLNLLMLYTEDTYEIPEYPYFGYLRGRYSQAELREIDGYA